MSPPLRGKANTFGRRSNGPMRARRPRGWASPIGRSCRPPFRQGSGPAPSHARWRRAAEWRPRLRWAEVDSPPAPSSGAGRREPKGRGPGGDRAPAQQDREPAPSLRRPTRPRPDPNRLASWLGLTAWPGCTPAGLHTEGSPQPGSPPPWRCLASFLPNSPPSKLGLPDRHLDPGSSTETHSPVTRFLRFSTPFLGGRLLTSPPD